MRLTRPFLFLLLAIQLLPAQRSGRISGYLRAGNSGEPLIYANVVLVGTYIGTASDVHGYYVIPDIPAGKYVLKAMMMGYKAQENEVEITAGSDQRIDIELPLTSLEGEEVTVTADRTRFEEKVEISRLNLSLREIKSTPALVEADLFRSLQLMPGVQAHNDFSSALVVRGGSPDENLILLDGIEVYNPFHLGGIFSTFNAAALADAEFLTGGFPAKYGNRNSSVLSITSKEGDSKNRMLSTGKFIGDYWNLSQFQGEISLLSSKFLAEGPIKNGSWMWAWRRSYYDTLARLYLATKGDEPLGEYYLWDTQGKLIYNLSPIDRLTFSAYYGRDVFFFDFDSEDQGFKLDMDWGNYTSSMQWRHVPNSKIVSQLSLARTNYDWALSLDFTQIDTISGNESTTSMVLNVQLQDWTLKEQLDWYISEDHMITGGFEFKILAMGVLQSFGNIDLIDRNQTPYILSFFAQDKWQASQKLSVQFGLRLSAYEIHDHLYSEPRFGFKYLLNENLAFKGSWGIYKQFIFTNSSDEDIINFVDQWIPVPENQDAQSAQHYILGLEQWFGEGFFASIEGYYKPYDNILDGNPLNAPGNDEDDFISGTGHAYGLEFLIKKATGKWSGWLGYTYSRLEKSIDLNSDGFINRSDGEIFNPKYDRPHNFNAVFNYELNQKHTFGLVITTNSGQPYTPVIGKTYAQANMGSYTDPYDNLQNLYGLRNSVRYPDYFRMDISWVKNVRPFGINGKFKLQVLNVTNHFNTLFYQWDHSESPSSVTAFSMFPILPTIGFEFKL